MSRIIGVEDYQEEVIVIDDEEDQNCVAFIERNKEHFSTCLSVETSCVVQFKEYETNMLIDDSESSLTRDVSDEMQQTFDDITENRVSIDISEEIQPTLNAGIEIENPSFVDIPANIQFTFEAGIENPPSVDIPANIQPTLEAGIENPPSVDIPANIQTTLEGDTENPPSNNIPEKKTQPFEELREMNFMKVAQVIKFYNRPEHTLWLIEKGLLNNSCKCHLCGSVMKLQSRKNVDGKCWRCCNHNCRTTASVRRGSFFATMHLPLNSLVAAAYFWSKSYSLEVLEIEAEINKSTAIILRRAFRQLCSGSLKSNRIGGPGRTIALKEFYRLHPRFKNKKCLIGGVDLENNDCFLELVDDLKPNTVKSVITKLVLSESEVCSDKISIFECLSEIGFLCRVFKPGKNKQDKQKREIVSSLWACCCRDLVRIFWNHNQYLDQGHIDEYLWRRKRQKKDLFPDFLAVLSEQRKLA